MIMNICKIMTMYFIVLLLFYVIHSNLNRFIISILLYIFSIIIFNIDYKLGCLYFLVGIGAALTEHVFIKYITLSWDYRKPNFLTIPFWLMPLWGIAIILIMEIDAIFKTIVN
jgi:hypothetical protein